MRLMDGWRTESTEKVERNKRKGGGGKRKREACQPMFSESVYSRSRSPVTSCSNDLIAVCRAHTNQGIDMCTLSPALRETGPKSFAGAQRHDAFHIFREKNKQKNKKKFTILQLAAPRSQRAMRLFILNTSRVFEHRRLLAVCQLTTHQVQKSAFYHLVPKQQAWFHLVHLICALLLMSITSKSVNAAEIRSPSFCVFCFDFFFVVAENGCQNTQFCNHL